mmetsp:Transcript_43978/g.133973  ORF Transcript_43978/g.133973 Transcript_43978/m.133973 type:complete len:217 (-) Transcript_43978:692-1342(-)|eukprot:CAMPEP_0113585730 /NCGR_PEP_ID=MMETSP0015_2-20120614/33875_1 /TAXON_ID=2838 /ORGANISM="Odontella" /LENGTH=216 /DNA_ID=CAMNT_0000491031 /DNA_START=102 /DNA_END=752 /DNA_ORIENTATION=- /assembly_acc=CAM_ASM_000160
MAYGEEVVAGYETCPTWAPILGFLAAGLCSTLANFGAAWGTWKSGLGLCSMGVNHPKGIVKNLVAIIMAGVLGIYGLIVSIIIAGGVTNPDNGANTYSQYTGWAHVCAGLCCGLSCLAAGGTIGLIGEMGVMATGFRAEINLAKASRPLPGQVGGGGADEDGGGGGGGAADDGGSGADENKLFVGMLIMLIFSEALALYGLIVALIVSQSQYKCGE